MGVQDGFGDHVVVTSSTTRVDTERLVAAAVRMGELARWARSGVWSIAAAQTAAAGDAGPAPAETAWSTALLEAAHAAGAAVSAQVERLAESLEFAALVYVGAEGDAVAFQSASHVLRPNADGRWTAGWGSVYTRERIRELFPMPVRGYVPGPMLDLLGAPWSPWGVGAGRAAGHHWQAAFGDGLHSDGADMMRVQLDIEQVSRIVDDAMFGVRRRPGLIPDEQAFAWWGNRPSHTGVVASYAGGWVFGIGRLAPDGPTRGVQVSTAVPVDTVDVRTGRPVAYRGSSVLVGSDAIAKSFGVALAPGGMGLLPLVSVLGVAGGGVPIAQWGTSVALPGTGRAPTATPTPLAPSALLDRIGDIESVDEHGQFEILRHRTPRPGADAADTSWSVVVRGMHATGISQDNPQDLLSCLEGVAGEPSDQQRAILEAMDRVGIAPGQPVEFVGHSQGAIMSAQLAADPSVAQRYHVVSVLTAAGPTAGSVPVGDARMLALENTRDGVPGLDGAANRDLNGSATVYFDGALVDNPRAADTTIGAHDLGVYSGAMAWLESQNASSAAGGAQAATSEVANWIAARQRSLGLTEDTRTTSYVFDTVRVR